MVASVLSGSVDVTDLDVIVSYIRLNRVDGRKVIFVGNGGSAAIANHAVADFEKNAGVRAVSLTDNPEIITAYGNDQDFTLAFANRLDVITNEEDIVIFISSSANSANLVEAAKVANSKGAFVFGLLGNHGGKLLEHCEAALLIRHDDTQVTEDVNSMFMHLLFREVMDGKPRELYVRP